MLANTNASLASAQASNAALNASIAKLKETVDASQRETAGQSAIAESDFHHRLAQFGKAIKVMRSFRKLDSHTLDNGYFHAGKRK